MRSVTFVGAVGGDGECFLWRTATEKDRAGVVGEQEHAEDRLSEVEFRQEMAQDRSVEYDPAEVDAAMRQLYPGQVCRALGVRDGRNYRFTISVEEVGGADEDIREGRVRHHESVEAMLSDLKGDPEPRTE